MLITLLSLFLAAPETAPAVAKPDAQSKADKKAEAKAQKAKMICRRESQIGSLVRSKRICRTAAEWKELEQQSKDYGNGIQKRTGEMPNPG